MCSKQLPDFNTESCVTDVCIEKKEMKSVVTDLSPPNTPSQFHIVIGKFYQIF